MTGAPASYPAANRKRDMGSATADSPATAGTAISRYSRTPWSSSGLAAACPPSRQARSTFGYTPRMMPTEIIVKIPEAIELFWL